MQSYSLFSQPATVISASGNSGDINTENVETLAFDATVSAIDGSTTLVIIVNRKGLDGAYYPIFTSSSVTSAPTVISESFGPGAHVPHVVGDVVQIAWTITAAKHATVSLSLAGK